MDDEKKRFIYHVQADPELRFYLQEKRRWRSVLAADLSAEELRRAKAGMVTYPSGEILAWFGSVRGVPEGAHYMEGPVYQDEQPGYSRALEQEGRDRVSIFHGASHSQAGDPRYHYSTSVLNLCDRRVRVTKFGPFDRTWRGVNAQPATGYYSPLQFKEWYRVKDADGWIHPQEVVCDPDNYGHGSGVWAYFLEDDQGACFIGTAPMGNG